MTPRDLAPETGKKEKHFFFEAQDRAAQKEFCSENPERRSSLYLAPWCIAR
jgi:hypothetical protein